MTEIDLFMWGFQQHFYISVAVRAEELLKYMIPDLQTKIFLVGVRNDGRANRHPICLEPEDCGYEPERFSSVFSDAEHIAKLDPEAELLYSGPNAEALQAVKKQRIETRALREAILRVINRGDYKSEWITYCSWPVLIDGYAVSVALQLEKAKVSRHYSLSEFTVNMGIRSMPLPVSLIDIAVDEFLEECSKALRQPDPGAQLNVIEKNSEEILRLAGVNFLASVSMRVRNDELPNQFLFRAFSALSAARYEGEENHGIVILADRGNSSISTVMSFRPEIDIDNTRAVRKLLQMTDDKFALLCDGSKVYGIGHSNSTDSHVNRATFTISFSKEHTWELLFTGQALMSVSSGFPSLPRPRIGEDEFKLRLERIFPLLTISLVNKLWRLAQAAVTQRHGTLLVISKEAEKEALRLRAQSTIIEPVEMTPDLISKTSAIDGAILLDHTGFCHAIGVILDGIASNKGDSSRGARYNSAIRYVESRRDGFEYLSLAIIISEDGSVDVIPKLRPRIKRTELNKAIEELRLSVETDDFNRKRYLRAEEVIRKLQFYLSFEQCQQANALLKQARNYMFSQDGWGIEERQLRPDEELNDTYFVEE